MTNPHTAKKARIGERTLLACTGCKQRKLKCDAQTPRCKNCDRTNRECLVEDPATGLQRPRNYMQSLESRVAYLESLLQQVRPDVATDHFALYRDGEGLGVPTAGGEAASDVPQMLQDQPFQSEVGLRHRAQSAEADEQNVDQLSSEVALLCISAAGREPHYFGPSSAVSFSRIVSATMGLPRNGGTSRPSVTSEPETEDKTQQRQQPRELKFPSAAARAKLTRAYFNNIHPQYPFLHQPTFSAWEEACVIALESDPTKVNAVALFFVLMVYAIGSMVLGQAQREAAQLYYSLALDHISAVLELDGLESIQAILCCAVYSIRSPVGVSLWSVSGMAIRHCIDLGYHRSAETFRRHADPLTKEMSKRCFWVAYDIDRAAAFILGRPVGLPDDAIDVEFPLDIDDENITRQGLRRDPRTSPSDPPTLMTGAIHEFKLRRFWTKIADILYPTTSQRLGVNKQKGSVEGLRQELEEWFSTAPCRLDYSKSHPLSVFTSSLWFQLAYDHSILLLYRHYIDGTAMREQQDDPAFGEITEKAFEECALRAREMCLLYRRVYQSPTVQFTWGSVHILFTGGLTYLYCLWKSKRVRSMAKQADVINTCLACTTVLIIIAERWNLATSYRDIFEVLSQRTISMVCGGDGSAGFSEGPFNGFQSMSSHTQHLVETDPPPLQDWIMGLDDMNIPQDSNWLVQELLQGVQQFQPDEFYNDQDPSTAPNILTQGFDPTLMDGNDMQGSSFESHQLG